MNFPEEFEAKKFRIDKMSTGEWELLVVLEDGTEIVHYTDRPDFIYEQLVEEKSLEP